MTEESRRRASKAGLISAANMTPDERAERSRKAGIASGIARNKARAAAGNDSPVRPNRNTRDIPMPTAEELEPYLIEIDEERRDPPLSYDARIREAALRLRRDVAEQTYAALKNKGQL